MDPFARIGVLALVGMAAATLWQTAAAEDEINTFAVVGALIFLALAAIMATGNWVAVGLSALFAGFQGATVWMGDRSTITDFSQSDALPTLVFVLFAAIAVVAGLVGCVRILRSRGMARDDA